MKKIFAVSTVAIFLLLFGCLGQPSTVAEWCKPGTTYGGAAAGGASGGAIIGLATHNGKQMCHMTSTTTTQGMTINQDCYYDQAEMCCVMTGIPGVQPTETCIPIK